MCFLYIQGGLLLWDFQEGLGLWFRLSFEDRQDPCILLISLEIDMYLCSESWDHPNRYEAQALSERPWP